MHWCISNIRRDTFRLFLVSWPRFISSFRRPDRLVSQLLIRGTLATNMVITNANSGTIMIARDAMRTLSGTLAARVQHFRPAPLASKSRSNLPAAAMTIRYIQGLRVYP